MLGRITWTQRYFVLTDSMLSEFPCKPDSSGSLMTNRKSRDFPLITMGVVAPDHSSSSMLTSNKDIKLKIFFKSGKELVLMHNEPNETKKMDSND